MQLMKKASVFIAILITILSFLPGCGDTNCPLTTVSLARFEFVDSRTHVPVSLTNGATVTGLAMANDSLIVDTVFNQAQNYMSVPLSYTHQTTYVIHYTELMRDTIEVVHKNTPFVSDIECSPMMFYQVEDIRYTTNALDSVILTNPQITNEERTNFYIYYHASDTE